MSREVANKLSSERREELRKNRELESNTALRLKTMLKVSWNLFARKYLGWLFLN
jgi:hypothetical protein